MGAKCTPGNIRRGMRQCCAWLPCISLGLINTMGFPGSSVGKDLPAKQKMRGRSLGQEDPLEKEMATHSSILAWKIPWTQGSGGLQSVGLYKVGHDLVTKQ